MITFQNYLSEMMKGFSQNIINAVNTANVAKDGYITGMNSSSLN